MGANEAKDNRKAHHHGRHYLPTHAIWATTFVIAFVAALTNFVMVWLDVKLVTLKFDTVQTVMTNSGPVVGGLVLACIACVYGGLATSLVCLVAPTCAGSGLPEVKGYLNGNHISSFFEVRTFFVRVLGIILSTSAGYPAGREGPMVCIGGWIGYRVADLCRQVTFLRKWLDIDVPHSDEEWFGEVRRISCTLGSAAGVATAFNAPLGGILYMLEEATVTSWAPETTFRAFVCTGVGVLFSRAFMNSMGSDFHRLVIFEPTEAPAISWDWIDVPFFLVLAAFVGSCSAGFTHVLIFVWKTRRAVDKKLARYQPGVKMGGAMLFAVLCALVMSLVPMVFDCVSEPTAVAGHRRLGGGAGLHFVQYDCPDGQHNVLATLLLNPGEAAVKHLVSRSGSLLGCGPLAVAGIVYVILAMGMPGLAVPMGNFIPAMVIGSLIGRFMGEGLDSIDSLHGEVTNAGVYAMVGSAAMLGGFTHMTIAIVCLLTEAGHDISLIPPLMLAIFVSHVFSHHLNHVGYDERLIILKGVPFLEPEMPEELDGPDALAKHVCNILPEEALLSLETTVEKAQKALDSDPVVGFPVLCDTGQCLGLTSRSRLLAAVGTNPKAQKLDLRSIMNPTPFSVLEDMPAGRFYQLFAKGLVAVAVCVVNKEGKFCGMLTRASILKAISQPEVMHAIYDKEHEGAPHAAPHTHHIPTYIVWAIMAIIAACVAMTNYFMVWVDLKLLTWKFEGTQSMMNDSGVGLGFLTLAGFSLLYSAIATCLVCHCAPMCAGSGLPEAKGYLNGNPIHHMFDYRTFGVRVLGIIFSTAAGYPAGREGPMVCIGGWIGEKVTHALVLPVVRKWVSLDSASDTFDSGALLVDEERFAEAKRFGAALGGAAGVAVAFNAPIGGILYMFEEVTVTSWAPELTFRALVITACAALASRALLNVTNADFHKLVIFEDNTQASVSWSWIDVPFFVILAATVGSFAAFFTRVLLFVWKSRRGFHKKLTRFQPYPKIIECVLYALFCAACFSLIPLAFDCVPDAQGGHRLLSASNSTQGSSAGHGSSGGGHGPSYVRYDCPAGEHNTLATLLLDGGEGIVKHLFSRSGELLKVGPLAAAAVVYAILAMGMAGLAVPMGNFIPCMVIGALFGRLLGELLDGFDSLHGEIASPGVYAMVGSAAMLGGFTHMTIAIVCLLTEAGRDITLVSPLMVSIFVAHVFSKIGNHHGFDEVLILLKGVPFLDAEIPHELEADDATAVQLCREFPAEAILETVTSVSSVQKALMTFDSPTYPIVRPMSSCVTGLASASRLKLWAPLAKDKAESGAYTHHVGDDDEDEMEDAHGEEDEDLHLDQVFNDMAKKGFTTSASRTSAVVHDEVAIQIAKLANGGETPLNLRGIMDPIPFEIIEDMPASITYSLFARGVVGIAVVISKEGQFRGVLARSNLMDAHRLLRPRPEISDAPLATPVLDAPDKVDEPAPEVQPQAVVPDQVRDEPSPPAVDQAPVDSSLRAAAGSEEKVAPLELATPHSAQSSESVVEVTASPGQPSDVEGKDLLPGQLGDAA